MALPFSLNATWIHIWMDKCSQIKSQIQKFQKRLSSVRHLSVHSDSQAALRPQVLPLQRNSQKCENYVLLKMQESKAIKTRNLRPPSLTFCNKDIYKEEAIGSTLNPLTFRFQRIKIMENIPTFVCFLSNSKSRWKMRAIMPLNNWKHSYLSQRRRPSSGVF